MKTIGKIFCVVFLLTGCQSESAARDALEKEGYTGVTLTKAKDGFSFTAKKGEASCTGTVSAKGFSSNMSTSYSASCAPVDHPCSPEFPAKCFDEARALDKSDPAKSAELYQKGCDGKDAACCTNLGVDYERGEGVAKDPAKALALYDKGCNGGNDLGCGNLGVLYRDGVGTEKDPAKAFAAFQKACDNGHLSSCVDVANALMNGKGTPKDQVKGRAILKQGCEKNDVKCCTNYGLALYVGDGGDVDKTRAEELFRASCEKDSGTACRNLGIMASEKTPPDPEHKEASWLEKACTLGDGGGCNQLGQLQRNGGAGLTKDPAKALASYEKACELGAGAGCFNIGLGKSQAWFGALDMKGAAEAFEKACELGYEKGCERAKAMPH